MKTNSILGNFQLMETKSNSIINGKLYEFVRMYGKPIYDVKLDGEIKIIYGLSTGEIVMLLEEQKIHTDMGRLTFRKILLPNGQIGYVLWDASTIIYFKIINQ